MRRHIVSIFVLLAFAACSSAQTGFPPFASVQNSNQGARNNQNLNAVFSVPIVSSPGRGLNLDFSIVYNSLNWAPGGGAWNPAYTTNPNAKWGWQLTFNPNQTTFVTTSSQGSCGHIIGDTGVTYITKQAQYQYIDQYGTAHPFGVWWKDVYSTCTSTDTYTGTFTGYATDGSGYYISISGTDGSIQSVLSRGGFNVTNAGMIIDTNGNYFSATNPVAGETDWIDTTGRTALKIITGTATIQYKVLDPTGAYQTTTLNLQSFNIKTNFACSGIIEYTGTASLPASLVLPNNQTYQFTYEPTPSNGGYYTGRLQRVTLPTGGYYEYDYTGSNDGISCTDGTTLSMNKVVSDGTNSATWKFVRNTTNLTTTITTPKLADTPNANDTVITFNSSGQEISRKIYKESPGVNVLATINSTWAANGTPATQITILEDGVTQSEVATTYGSNGLLNSVSEYNWGSGAPGSLFRTTNYTYQTSTNYTNLNIIDLITSTQIQDGSGIVQYRQDVAYDATSGDNQSCPTGVPQHLDASYGCSFYYRGNPTSVTTYIAPGTPANGITKNFTYDWFGNVLTAQLNCCQNKTWAYSSATNYSQPDSVTSGSSAPTLTTSFAYNSYTGQLTKVTDPNNLVTTLSYDYLRRPTSIAQAIGSTNGASATYSYDDTHFTVTTSAAIDSSKSIQQISALDGLGRRKLLTTEDATNNTYSEVTTVYNLAGRPYQTSNPYTGTSPSYWTSTAFDVLGRPTSVTMPDNSATSYSYTTNTATSTDPTGKQRKAVIDAAGRLYNIWEPDPTNNNSLTLQTSFAYNVLDELTSVSQGVQSRTFTYDALGRITSISTPEAGRICLGTVSSGVCQANGYDSFDNLLYRTDARGVQANFIYDSLNRLLGVSYSNVPSSVSAMPNVCATTGSSSANANVCFIYGTSSASFNNGQVVSMNDATGSENYIFNNLGQLTQLQKAIGSSTYVTNYTYNIAGELTQITYPSGRSVTQNLDAIGRISSVIGTLNSVNTTYASGTTYNPAFQMTGFQYGNNLNASFGFSQDRLQLNCIDYSTTNRGGTCAHDSTTKFGLTYSYGSTGSNNGMISSISDSVDSGRSISYNYDALYRLVSAVTAGSTNYAAWGLSETYDRYGNRTMQSVTAGTGPSNSVSVSATTNQITGSPYAYDADGNMTNDGVNTLVYDGENRATSATNGANAGAYVYDGKGLRVKKCVPNCASPTTSTVYIFSGSKVIAEYDNGAAVASPTREYIYSGARLIAKIDSAGTKYYHRDNLSNRLISDSNGNTVAQMGHFPFGESWYNTNNDKLVFTTYERDSESGNDYAKSRYYISRLGRFSSPDSLAGDITNPQSLNRYSYVLNSPTNLTDSTGHDPDCSDDARNHGRRSFEIAALGHSHLLELAAELWTDDGCGDSGGGGGGGGAGDSGSGDSGTGDSGSGDSGTNPGDNSGDNSSGNGTTCDENGNCTSPDGSTTCDADGNCTSTGDSVEVTADPQEAPDLQWTPNTDQLDISMRFLTNLPILDSLGRLRNLLKDDPDCLKFLSSKGTDALGRLDEIIKFAAVGKDLLPITTDAKGNLTSIVNAVSGPTPLAPGSAFTVNAFGAFFQKSFLGVPIHTDNGKIRGGSFQAQAFIALHELGHSTEVLLPDKDNKKAGEKNDTAVDKNCKKTIDAAKKQ